MGSERMMRSVMMGMHQIPMHAIRNAEARCVEMEQCKPPMEQEQMKNVRKMRIALVDNSVTRQVVFALYWVFAEMLVKKVMRSAMMVKGAPIPEICVRRMMIVRVVSAVVFQGTGAQRRRSA